MHPEEKLFENVSYKCPHCGDLFELQRKMYDHIKDEHPGTLLTFRHEELGPALAGPYNGTLTKIVTLSWYQI
jgi:hypothetical protein